MLPPPDLVAHAWAPSRGEDRHNSPNVAMKTLRTPTPNSVVLRLAASQGLSYAGRGAALTALIWALYAATGSAWWLSVAMLAIFGAATAVSPWTGHAGDRHDRRIVIMVSALLAAIGFGVCALLVWRGDVLATIAVMVAAGCTQGALTAAVQGAVPNLVADDELTRANSLAGAFRSAGYMLGPGIGGALLAVTTAPGVFAVSAAMLAVSALLMVGIRAPFHADRLEELGGRMDGFRQLVADRWMRRLTLAWSLIMVGVGPVIVAEVVLAHRFGVGSVGYGMISVFWDGGGVCGAILGARLARRLEQPAVVGGSGAIAAGFAIVGLTPVFWPVLVGMMIAGVFDSFGTVAAQNVLQRRTPDRLRSRVSAALDAVVLGAMGLSFALGAPLVTWLGAQGVYLAAAGLTAVATLMLLPALRGMPEPVVVSPRRSRPVETGRAKPEPRHERARRPRLLRRHRLRRSARRDRV
jgi:MFS transporter, DHA3 family, macrolide efflux protein